MPYGIGRELSRLYSQRLMVKNWEKPLRKGRRDGMKGGIRGGGKTVHVVFKENVL
jgi:hypothetical protein